MSERDIESEYRVWVRMFGEKEADRLREEVELDEERTGGKMAPWNTDESEIEGNA